MKNCIDMVSSLLMRFLSNIVPNECCQLAIAYSISSAARPRSFISPILIAISFYISRKYKSREPIDVLSALSIADDYREVLRLKDSLMPDSSDNEPTLKEWCSGTLNLIFDNGDIDACTLTGLDT